MSNLQTYYFKLDFGDTLLAKPMWTYQKGSWQNFIQREFSPYSLLYIHENKYFFY